MMIAIQKIIGSFTDISVMPNEQTIQRYAWPSLTVMSHYDDGTSLILILLNILLQALILQKQDYKK